MKPTKHFDFAIELLFLALVFLLPTVFDRRVGIVFSMTKVTFLEIFGSIILGVWALKIIILKEHKWFRTILDWPVLSFILCCTIATITSVHVYTSLFGFYGRFEGLFTWYGYALLFFVVTNFVRSREQLMRIFALVTMVGALMGIYSIIQRYGIDPYAWGGVVTWQRVIATIGQPNFLAAYVDMAFFLGLAFLLLPKEEKGFSLPAIAPFACFALCPVIFLIMIYTFEPALQNIFPAEQVDNVFGWLWYAGWAAMTACALFFAYTFRRLPPLILDCLIIVSLTLMWIAVLFTQSRGGLIGLFAAGSLFLILVNREALLSNWKKLLALSIAVVFITGLIVTGSPELSPFKRFSEEVKGKPVEVGEAKGGEGVPAGYSAAASRLETWKSATRIVADHPFFGIGPEVMKMVFPRYETELFRFKEAFHVKQDRCHNEIFDVAVTKGIISLFVYVWLLGSVFFIGFKKLRKEDIFGNLVVSGLLSAMVGYLVQNQFSFGVVAITSLFWIMIGVLANEQS